MKGKHLSHCKTKGQTLLTIQTITYTLPSHTQKDARTHAYTAEGWVRYESLGRCLVGAALAVREV